ncbi:ribosomal-processing cysteine protease Prp [Alicyclobacillus kakegawensis]|uniref:ribosomal-processing cysteine protease Prp n=1 Tax=Alicyclobacillus kakegawensis TaxID=392012 RepID=UPI0008304CFF|nr:ribosomal-processing cysteine protease Prp [Alicyclobacillus kakegawensis]
MIVCDVTEVNGRIHQFRLRGHAGYADVGSDIVCAAVSALVTNAINSCEALLRVVPECTDDGDELFCRLPSHRISAETDLLFRSMVLGLEQISEQYPRHVQVRMHHE